MHDGQHTHTDVTGNLMMMTLTYHIAVQLSSCAADMHGSKGEGVTASAGPAQTLPVGGTAWVAPHALPTQ
jgi:hypothetical protein